MKTYKVQYEIAIEARDQIEAEKEAKRIAIRHLEEEAGIISVTELPENLQIGWYIFNRIRKGDRE